MDNFKKTLSCLLSNHDTSINNKKTKQVKLYIEDNNIKKLDKIASYYNISKSLAINDILKLIWYTLKHRHDVIFMPIVVYESIKNMLSFVNIFLNTWFFYFFDVSCKCEV